VKEVIGANTSKVTSLYRTFYQCSNLEKVALFDTSKVTTFYATFYGCFRVTSFPKFLMNMVTTIYSMFSSCTGMSKLPDLEFYVVENCSSAFSGCINVSDGDSITTMYERLSALSSVQYHSGTFTNCGSNTVGGTAALAQIPSSWGGTGT
jgi:hypothetical protein